MLSRPGSSPVQVVGVPVSDDYVDYLQDVAKRLRDNGIRVEVDASDDRMPKKIRNASKAKMPFVLIAGEEDAGKGAVSFRYRDGSQRNGVPVEEAVEEILAAVRDRVAGLSVPGAAEERGRRIDPPASYVGRPGRVRAALDAAPDGLPGRQNKPERPRRPGPVPVLRGRPHAATRTGSSSGAVSSTYAVLNLYPYNPGHVMICPYRHVALYDEITDAEREEMAALTQQAMRALRRVAAAARVQHRDEPGAVAGAGIAAHLHQHVVPRWAGDANFLPIVARTKALPQLLGDTRQRLANAWPATP